jgi:hypothetical protein
VLASFSGSPECLLSGGALPYLLKRDASFRVTSPAFDA